MINIKHPKVVSKPPLSKCSAVKRPGKDIIVEKRMPTNNEIFTTSDSVKLKDLKKPDPSSDEIDTMIQNIGHDIKRLQPTSDFNQNVIEPDSCSFDQLCSMINDLEQNIAGNGSTQLNDEREFTIHGKHNDAAYFREGYQDYLINNQLQPERDYAKKSCGSSPSTYEDIMSLLGVLDQEGYLMDASSNHVNIYSKNLPETSNNQYVQCHSNQGNHSLPRSIPETFREDLATVQLQLEERNETVKFLKNELKSQRTSACEKLESQKKQHAAELQTQKRKYQTTIKRHQKFIEQIISDKKDLTEKCNALTQHIKEMEVKYQREYKVVADRHAVELQRARELCAASEKIRRERWLEAKTSKIKEMTVKGLEPELRSMVEQHQQELQEIRSAHIKELQDTELRTIRRSNQQLEQLRLELTASHEKILSSEKEILNTRYQEKLEQQETLFHEQRRKLLDDLERERRMLTEDRKRLIAEKDAAINQASSQFKEKVDTLMRQNQIEKKSLQESLKVEQETWMENCRRQHNLKLEKMESRLRDECNRDRDRQIELAIERLEKETLEMKTSLQQSSENRLRCMKEKYEAELQDSSNSEELLKTKVTSMQERLTEATSQLQKTQEKLQQCSLQLSNSDQIVDQLTMERNNAKKIVRQEIETEKRELENKIASLYKELTENNSNRDVQMAQLYSRVRLIVTQKDLAIGKLMKDNDETKKKCDHLEKLLDQQRREYVLKSL